MASTPLATDADVVLRLGRSLTSTEAARIAGLLADISAAVRLYTGQQFTEATTTDTFKLRRGAVRLPQRPATAVASVVDINSNPVLYQWDGLETVTVSILGLGTFAFEPWRTIDMDTVTVTYTHGYPTGSLPESLTGIVCQIAMRSLGADPSQTGLTSESIAGYSYSVGTAAATQAFGLLPGEREALDKFTRTLGLAEMTP